MSEGEKDQQIIVGNVALEPAPNGGAIASAVLLGFFEVKFLVPPEEVARFDQVRLEAKKSKLARINQEPILLPKGKLHA
jgi:hypothetical protein